MRSRPAGITLLAAVLVLLALVGFLMSMTAETVAEQEGPRWQLLRFGALLYGVTAIVAAIGLWKLRRWGYLAFVGWVGAVLLASMAVPAAIPEAGLPWWAPLVWIGLIALIVIPLARYVRREIPPPM
jgi:peptidoglycan/LPS O-acetylase OafA/YrhL